MSCAVAALLNRGAYGSYFADLADDYANHVLVDLADFELSSRAQLDLAATTEKDHWDRGSYQTDGIDPTSPAFPTEPDEFDRNKLEARFRYGAEGNRGRLNLGVGGSQLAYTNNRARKTSNPTWAVDVRWSPRKHSHVAFMTSRVNEETTREGAFIDTTTVKLGWTHQWSQLWESVICWARIDYDFIGSPRDQSWNELSLGLRYKQGRLLTWDAGYARRSRDSSQTSLVYVGDMFSIGVNIAN